MLVPLQVLLLAIACVLTQIATAIIPLSDDEKYLKVSPLVRYFPQPDRLH